jgi:hypothetical protein
MKKHTIDPSVNLLDVKPQRSAEWVREGDESVVILIPKFSNPFLVRWLLPYLKSRNFRLTLDRYGSAFWLACDGTMTVADVIEAMKRRFPDEADTMSERVIGFTRHLYREKFIHLDTASV